MPNDVPRITLAAKCAPDSTLLGMISDAGFEAVELYLAPHHVQELQKTLALCAAHPLRYALHAPNESLDIKGFAALAEGLSAEVAVFHDIYYPDEWEDIAKAFAPLVTKPCVENVGTVLEPKRSIRRFGLGLCLDIEHLILECAGVFEEEYRNLMAAASHIHMTGYSTGSELWHTPLHHSPRQSGYFLDMMSNVGYSGLVVSEAKTSHQSPKEFAALMEFFRAWQQKTG